MPAWPELITWCREHAVSVIGAIFALAGLGMLIRVQLVGAAARTWHATDGIIRHATLQLQRGSGGDASHVWGVDIVYDYLVGDRDYVGQRISPTGDVATSLRASMQAKIAPFQAGTIVPVYYDPARPDRCCLTRHADGTGLALAFLLGGLVFTIGPLLVG
ncbi:MAG: DUF3592 domain-containing protein [Phycisphaerales bacterium]|nr:DUF3592 domain-containing protein [Phycisphaerales bacterium]